MIEILAMFRPDRIAGTKGIMPLHFTRDRDSIRFIIVLEHCLSYARGKGEEPGGPKAKDSFTSKESNI